MKFNFSTEKDFNKSNIENLPRFILPKLVSLKFLYKQPHIKCDSFQIELLIYGRIKNDFMQKNIPT